MREKLVYLNSLTSDIKQIQAIIRNDPSLKKISRTETNNYIKQINCNFITIFDAEYPSSLKLSKNPPWVLYYLGNVKNITLDKVAIIGSRSPSKYGLTATKDTVGLISDTQVLLTGYGQGTAKQAIITAITNKTKIVVITSHGLDKQNQDDKLLNYLIENQLVISHVPPFVTSNHKYIQIRNQLIGMLATYICVIEAKKNSPILNIVNTALEFDIPIYALPGQIYDANSEGTNMLLQEGANLLYLK